MWLVLSQNNGHEMQAKRKGEKTQILKVFQASERILF